MPCEIQSKIILFKETKKSTENITRIVETLLPSADAERERARKYKSTQSLHELGLDNYPNPEYPESSRLTRKEEKQSLQNLNNRLASKLTISSLKIPGPIKSCFNKVTSIGYDNCSKRTHVLSIKSRRLSHTKLERSTMLRECMTSRFVYNLLSVAIK
jgi:hypothetical protein